MCTFGLSGCRVKPRRPHQTQPDEKGRFIGGLDGTDDCGADGGFDGGYDGGSGGFEPKQRNGNCKRRSRGY